MRLTLGVGCVLVALAVLAGGCESPEPGATAPPAAKEAVPTTIPAPPDVASPPADAAKTASGIAYKILKPGTGTVHPTPQSTVTANYTGWTLDGHMFDSSVVNNKPLVYPLYRLIPGWVEGMQLMVVGEKRRFWIPGNLAYDASPDPTAPKGMLVFDIELLNIQ
jgi:FKBP-type peptidyl-prolyl cis-trans isomerase